MQQLALVVVIRIKQSICLARALSVHLLGWLYLFGGYSRVAAAKWLWTTLLIGKDAVEQYEMAKRGGDRMQVCVHAGFVTAAYLQAKDEANYQEWLKIKKNDCRAAGLPE